MWGKLIGAAIGIGTSLLKGRSAKKQARIQGYVNQRGGELGAIFAAIQEGGLLDYGAALEQVYGREKGIYSNQLYQTEQRALEHQGNLDWRHVNQMGLYDAQGTLNEGIYLGKQAELDMRDQLRGDVLGSTLGNLGLLQDVAGSELGVDQARIGLRASGQRLDLDEQGLGLGSQLLGLANQNIGLQEQDVGLFEQNLGLQEQGIGLDAQRLAYESRRLALGIAASGWLELALVFGSRILDYGSRDLDYRVRELGFRRGFFNRLNESKSSELDFSSQRNSGVGRLWKFGQRERRRRLNLINYPLIQKEALLQRVLKGSRRACGERMKKIKQLFNENKLILSASRGQLQP